MAKNQSRSRHNSLKLALANATHTLAATEAGHNASGVTVMVMPKTRQLHKLGEVNISAYLSAEVKTSLRMVLAKTGHNLKHCLPEALHDLFRKHNVPVFVELGKGH